MASLEDRMSYCRRVHDESQVLKMENLTFEWIMLKFDRAFNGYCSVTWKLERKLVKASSCSKSAVKYHNKLYFFDSPEKRNLFISNP